MDFSFLFLLQADITDRDGCGEIILTCSRGLKKETEEALVESGRESGDI